MAMWQMTALLGWVVRGYLQDKLVQVSLDDHVLYGLHGDLEQVGVGGIGEVAVNLLMWVAVECSELVHEVLAGGLPVRWVALKVWEAVLGDWVVCDLLFEEIHLVKEENEGGVGEPLGVGNRLPQHESFLHLVLRLLANGPTWSFSSGNIQHLCLQPKTDRNH